MKYWKQNTRLKINIVVSLLLQIVVFVSGIVLPRLFISIYGSKVNGLVASIQQFLGFITLGELGIGAVVQYNLYKPLAEEQWDKVSSIVLSARRFFNRLVIGILIYVIFLACLLPFKVAEDFGYFYTASLVLAISFSYFMQYYFGMAYKQLLDADQLSFVRIIPQIIQIILNIVFSFWLINLHFSIQKVKFVTSILYSIQPLVMYIFVNKYYKNLNLKKGISGEPIKQKWNGIAQHIAAVVLKDTDIVVLTLFSTLENVSIYAVYNLVISGIQIIIESVVTNFTAIFGRFLAKNEIEEITKYFDKFEIIYHFGVTIIFFCIGRLIVPFVMVYTKGITDANYFVPEFAIILTVAQWLYCSRIPYHLMIKAAGHYKETQWSAIMEAIINVVISIIAVFRFGLMGVAIGTATAMLYRSIYYWGYLKKNILQRSLVKIFKIYGSDLITVIISIILTHSICLEKTSYVFWILMAIKVLLINLIVSVIVYGCMYHRNIKEIIKFSNKY